MGWIVIVNALSDKAMAFGPFKTLILCREAEAIFLKLGYASANCAPLAPLTY